jgi:hypothetical protein
VTGHSAFERIFVTESRLTSLHSCKFSTQFVDVPNLANRLHFLQGVSLVNDCWRVSIGFSIGHQSRVRVGHQYSPLAHPGHPPLEQQGSCKDQQNCQQSQSASDSTSSQLSDQFILSFFTSSLRCCKYPACLISSAQPPAPVLQPVQPQRQ